MQKNQDKRLFLSIFTVGHHLWSPNRHIYRTVRKISAIHKEQQRRPNTQTGIPTVRSSIFCMDEIKKYRLGRREKPQTKRNRRRTRVGECSRNRNYFPGVVMCPGCLGSGGCWIRRRKCELRCHGSRDRASTDDLTVGDGSGATHPHGCCRTS